MIPSRSAAMAAMCGTAPEPTASASTLSSMLPSMRDVIVETSRRKRCWEGLLGRDSGCAREPLRLLDEEVRIAGGGLVIAPGPVGADAAGVGQHPTRFTRHVRPEVPAGGLGNQVRAHRLLVVVDPRLLAGGGGFDRRPALRPD